MSVWVSNRRVAGRSARAWVFATVGALAVSVAGGLTAFGQTDTPAPSITGNVSILWQS